jgi:hypothetical protein
MDREYFTTFEAIKIIGIKRERLKDWLERGFLKATRVEETGPGLKAYFDRWGLYMIRLFLHLVEHGISRREASRWIFEMSEDRSGGDPLGEFMQRNFGFILVERKDGKVMDLRFITGSLKYLHVSNDIDDAFIINFGNVRKQVDEGIALLRSGEGEGAAA